MTTKIGFVQIKCNWINQFVKDDLGHEQLVGMFSLEIQRANDG